MASGHTDSSPTTPEPTPSFIPVVTSMPSTPPAQTTEYSMRGPQSPQIDTSVSDARHRSTQSASSLQSDRPSLGQRKPSGTIIIPRDSPTVEVSDEHYEEGDARAMSPRRGSDEIEKMSDEAREALEAQAKNLQDSLSEIVDRVEAVKNEHEKLEGGNKFLQSYIGELMQTSNLTAAGAAKSKSKPRARSAKPK